MCRGTALSVLHVLSHLMTVGSKYYIYPNFTEDEIETLGRLLNSVAYKCLSWDLNLCMLVPVSELFPTSVQLIILGSPFHMDVGGQPSRWKSISTISLLGPISHTNISPVPSESEPVLQETQWWTKIIFSRRNKHQSNKQIMNLNCDEL